MELSHELPALSTHDKRNLIGILPLLSLAIGFLSLLSAYWLWQWAHLSNLIDYVNTLSQNNGGGTVIASRMTASFWLALLLIILQAMAFLAAYSLLRVRAKAGWNLVFYGVIINALYGLIILFTDYGIGHTLYALFTSVIGLYFLFQVRAAYSHPVR